MWSIRRNRIQFPLQLHLNICIVLPMFTVEELGQEIAKLAVHLDAATHRLLECIRQFDAECGWEPQGAVSCAHWLSWRIGLDPATAREKVRVARALGNLPSIDAALKSGKLSYAKVRALTRVATPETEAKLLDAAMVSTGAQLERLCRGYRTAKSEMTADNALPPPERSVRRRDLPGGMVKLEIVLTPDEADLVLGALDRARGLEHKVDEHRIEQPDPKRPSRADGMVALAESYLAGNAGTGNGGERFQVMLHVDQDPLAPDGALAGTLDDGTRVSAEAIRRVACDCGLVAVGHDKTGTTLSIGRRSRSIPPGIRRALLLRDRGCAFPAAPTTDSCTATTSSTGCTGAKRAWTTFLYCARTTTTWSTKAVGPSSERRTGICAFARRMGMNCQRCPYRRPAKMQSCSCTNGPRTADWTSGRIPTCRFGMGHGQTTTGQRRRWWRRRGGERGSTPKQP
jgi:hypothetical protein